MDENTLEPTIIIRPKVGASLRVRGYLPDDVVLHFSTVDKDFSVWLRPEDATRLYMLIGMMLETRGDVGERSDERLTVNCPYCSRDFGLGSYGTHTCPIRDMLTYRHSADRGWHDGE